MATTTDVQYRVYDPTNTNFLGTLTRAYGKTYVDALSSQGMGRFLIDLDDPQAGLVQARRVVRVRIHGTDRFAFIIDDMPRDISGGEEEPPSMEVSGPGLAGWLGTGRGGALVYPPRFRTRATNRVFGWQSLAYNLQSSDGWVSPSGDHTLGRQDSPTSLLPRLRGEPPKWPDKRAEWMTLRPLSVSPGGSVYHGGSNEMLLARHLPALSGEFPARIYCAGTNEWDLYFDGERVAGGGGFRNVVETDVFFENRETVVAAAVRQERTPTFKYDPLAFILTIVKLDENGSPAGVIFRTYTTGNQPGSPPQRWRLLADPDEHPGLFPGHVMAPLISDAKARGTIPSLKFSTWNHTTDSNGDPWDATLSHSVPIGTKLSEVLDQVVGITGIEYRVTPGGELLLANRLGVARAGPLSPLVEAAASGEGVRATVLLGQAEDGFLQRSHGDQVTLYGRIEDAVTMGTHPSRLGLRKPLDRMLASAARIRDEHDYVLGDDAPQPYVDFDLGDTYPEGRVTQVTMTQDNEAAAVEWAVSLVPEEL